MAFAAGIGGLAGAALTSRRGHRAAAIGAAIGATGLATSEWIARSLQRPGEIPALWQRIATTAALAAPLGWVAEQAHAGPTAVATGTGALAGLLGVRPQKVALGPLLGYGIGRAVAARYPDAPGSVGRRWHHARLPHPVAVAVSRSAGQAACRRCSCRTASVRRAA